MSPKRVGDTPTMSREDMSGHMNADFSAPYSPSRYPTPGPGRLREADADWHLKQPVVIQDISADRHESTEFTQIVHGMPFKVRSDA